LTADQKYLLFQLESHFIRKHIEWMEIIDQQVVDEQFAAI
jgi:hypothetical protein